MAFDPDLAAETCIFMQPGSPHFWLSDDLQHVAPPPAGVALPGVTNDIQVTVRHKAGCALPANAAAVKIDLWVCTPTSSPINVTSGQTKHILDAVQGSISVPLGTGAGQLAPGGSVARIVKWALANGSTHPAEQPGHKCLIARAYPNSVSTNETLIGDYAASLDPHYAQRNICIQTCNSPCGQEIVVFHVEEEQEPVEIVFDTFVDPNPHDLFPRSQIFTFPTREGEMPIRSFATLPPRRGFTLDMKELNPFEFFDNSRPKRFDPKQIRWPRRRRKFLRRTPEMGDNFAFVRAVTRIEPGQVSTYTLETDLEEFEPGTAQVFHVTESVKGRIRGGLTVLMVKAG